MEDIVKKIKKTLIWVDAKVLKLIWRSGEKLFYLPIDLRRSNLAAPLTLNWCFGLGKEGEMQAKENEITHDKKMDTNLI